MTGRCAVCVALTALAGVATARGNAPWDGGYLGFDAGDGSSSACTEWTLTGVAADPANTGPFNSSNCSKKDGLVAGLKGGENFQYKRLVWGIGADLDYWGSKTTNQSFTYAGAWSISAEYLRANLGKGSDSTAACAGTATVCAGFSGLSLDGTHGGFSSNIVRVGVVYYFGYWDI
jgi:hypothetical protein